MPLTRYGLREWLAISLVLAAVAALVGWLASWWWALPVAVVWLLLVSFFRDPVRRVPRDLAPGTMLSPADGRVSAVREVVRHEAVDGPAVVIRIFLSVLDVHVNRAPCAGTVERLDYAPGRFLNAMRDDSAEVNEANLITMRTDDGEPIGVRQVAGMIARRIVCPLAAGERLVQGQRFGMIKFGSTTELILPRPGQVRVLVREGDRVKGGLTRLATLAPR